MVTTLLSSEFGAEMHACLAYDGRLIVHLTALLLPLLNEWVENREERKTLKSAY